MLRAVGGTGQNFTRRWSICAEATCCFAGNSIGYPGVSDLLRILLKVDEAEAKFKSLTEELDTTTPMGCMFMQVVGSFAEFEGSIIKKRTKLANGRIGYGRYKLSPSQQVEAIKMIRLGRRVRAKLPNCSMLIGIRFQG
jgi:Resolvase, N terminal domain